LDRVGDEVGGETPDQPWIAYGPRRLQRQHVRERTQVVFSQRLTGDRREVDRLVPLRAAMAPGKRKTGFEQSFLLLAGTENVLADLTPGGRIRPWIAECQFEQRALGRQRCTQLMGQIRRIALSALELLGRRWRAAPPGGRQTHDLR